MVTAALKDEEWIRRLHALGQAHVIPSDATSQEVRSLCMQLEEADAAYPGGLVSYLERARKLLAEAKAGASPFADFIALKPKGERLTVLSPAFETYERAGLQHIGCCAFVLVAGGLGERLGYHGIKIGLPCEVTTSTTFAQLYCDYILAFQALRNAQLQEQGQQQVADNTSAACAAAAATLPAKEAQGSNSSSSSSSGGISGCSYRGPLPLAIMTSDDTHQRTVQLFEENGFFGLQRKQVTFMKQGKVPALIDDAAHLGSERVDSKEHEGDAKHSSALKLLLKPHGHGDVHTLLHQHHLDSKWKEQGIRWIVFFQDTNVLTFRAIPAALGVSATHQFALNSIAVPRREVHKQLESCCCCFLHPPLNVTFKATYQRVHIIFYCSLVSVKAAEAMGALCLLRSKADSHSVTLNVEYNVLGPLLQAQGSGDVPNAAGFSDFPGNTNALIFSIESYCSTLQKTGGTVPEFINPKYKDVKKTAFKSPTRLECMMQDLPRLFSRQDRVGFTELERWFCYSPVKNNAADAAQKAAQHIPPECALSGEADLYHSNGRLLALVAESYGAVVDFGAPQEVCACGVKYALGPRVVLSPSWAVSTAQMKSRLAGVTTLKVTSRSTLLIEGEVFIKHLELDGAAILRAPAGCKLIIDHLVIKNEGWPLILVKDGEKEPPAIALRGFRFERKETYTAEVKGGGNRRVVDDR